MKRDARHLFPGIRPSDLRTALLSHRRNVVDADIANARRRGIPQEQLVDGTHEMKAGRGELFINPHLIQALSAADRLPGQISNENSNFQQLANFIWSVADLLRIRPP